MMDKYNHSNRYDDKEGTYTGGDLHYLYPNVCVLK